MNSPVQFITLPEAARRLSVCRRTIEREIQRGNFPPLIRVTRRAVRVSVPDLEAYARRLQGKEGQP